MSVNMVIAKNKYGPDSSQLIKAKSHLAGALQHLGEIDASIEVLEECLNSFKPLPANHPQHLQQLKEQLAIETQIAFTYKHNGQLSKSLELLMPILEKRETHFGSRPNTCLLYTSPSPRDQRGSRMPSSA